MKAVAAMAILRARGFLPGETGDEVFPGVYVTSEEVESLVPYVESGLTVQMENTGDGSMFGVYADGEEFVSVSPLRAPARTSDIRTAIRQSIAGWRHYQLSGV